MRCCGTQLAAGGQCAQVRRRAPPPPAAAASAAAASPPRDPPRVWHPGSPRRPPRIGARLQQAAPRWFRGGAVNNRWTRCQAPGVAAVQGTAVQAVMPSPTCCLDEDGGVCWRCSRVRLPAPPAGSSRRPALHALLLQEREGAKCRRVAVGQRWRGQRQGTAAATAALEVDEIDRRPCERGGRRGERERGCEAHQEAARGGEHAPTARQPALTGCFTPGLACCAQRIVPSRGGASQQRLALTIGRVQTLSRRHPSELGAGPCTTPCCRSVQRSHLGCHLGLCARLRIVQGIAGCQRLPACPARARRRRCRRGGRSVFIPISDRRTLPGSCHCCRRCWRRRLLHAGRPGLGGGRVAGGRLGKLWGRCCGPPSRHPGGRGHHGHGHRAVAQAAGGWGCSGGSHGFLLQGCQPAPHTLHRAAARSGAPLAGVVLAHEHVPVLQQRPPGSRELHVNTGGGLLRARQAGAGAVQAPACGAAACAAMRAPSWGWPAAGS